MNTGDFCPYLSCSLYLLNFFYFGIIIIHFIISAKSKKTLIIADICKDALLFRRTAFCVC